MPSDSRPTSPTARKATSLELLHDLPDADIAPPDPRGWFFRENGGGQMGGSLGPQDFEETPKNPGVLDQLVLSTPPRWKTHHSLEPSKIFMSSEAQHDFLDSTFGFSKGHSSSFSQQSHGFHMFSAVKKSQVCLETKEIFPERNELESRASYWGLPQKIPFDVFFCRFPFFWGSCNRELHRTRTCLWPN